MSSVSAQTAKIIEALIYASSIPVPRRQLEKHLPEGEDLDAILRLIADRYGEDSGIELRQMGNAWAFRTKAEISSLLMIEKVTERTLSRAALETLAIIAYHQPVTRAEIEEIRGVSISSGTMDILLEQGWIKPRGRRRTPGKPLTWGTTEGFLDHFGLEDLNDLPGVDELKQAGLLRSGTSISDRSGLSELLATDMADREEDMDDDAQSFDDQFPDFAIEEDED